MLILISKALDFLSALPPDTLEFDHSADGLASAGARDQRLARTLW